MAMLYVAEEAVVAIAGLFGHGSRLVTFVFFGSGSRLTKLVLLGLPYQASPILARGGCRATPRARILIFLPVGPACTDAGGQCRN